MLACTVRMLAHDPAKQQALAILNFARVGAAPPDVRATLRKDFQAP